MVVTLLGNVTDPKDLHSLNAFLSMVVSPSESKTVFSWEQYINASGPILSRLAGSETDVSLLQYTKALS